MFSKRRRAPFTVGKTHNFLPLINNKIGNQQKSSSENSLKRTSTAVSAQARKSVRTQE